LPRGEENRTTPIKRKTTGGSGDARNSSASQKKGYNEPSSRRGESRGITVKQKGKEWSSPPKKKGRESPKNTPPSVAEKIRLLTQRRSRWSMTMVGSGSKSKERGDEMPEQNFDGERERRSSGNKLVHHHL